MRTMPNFPLLLLLLLPPLLLSLISITITPASAVKMEIPIAATPVKKCLAQYIDRGTHVTGNVEVLAVPGQAVDVEVSDSMGNQYWRSLAFTGTQRFIFTTHDAVEVDYCFVNRLTDEAAQQHRAGAALPTQHRVIKLQVETLDSSYSTDEGAEKALKPIEAQLKKVEGIMSEVQRSMQGYVQKEIGLRDINESTNARIKHFGFYSFSLLLLLGVWQVWYLYGFFKTKHLI